MFRLLKRLFKKTTGQEPESFTTRAVAYPFCVAAVLFFGFQVTVVTMGSLELIWPNLPAPVPFRSGRMVHLNLSVFWPLMATIGAAFYFFPGEAKNELAHPRMARLLSYGLPVTLVGILLSFVFGLTEGREYLEAIRPFDWAITLALLLFSIILTQTYLKKATPKLRPALLGMLLGAYSLLGLFIPNLFFYSHPAVDEVVKFWVVHLWEEMSLELLGTSIIAAYVLSSTPRNRRAVHTILYLDLAFVLITGFFATGHHYYWIGLPHYWLWVGGIFSTLQVLPSVFLIYSQYKSYRAEKFQSMSRAEKLGFAFIVSSLFYHFLGAGVLGWILAMPFINNFAHGTYLTSSHAHFALFGVFGFLALGFAVYILTNEFPLKNKDYKRLWWSIAFLNVGLLIMGLALAIAGTLETYLYRILGNDFMETQRILIPYLVIRTAGGAVFSAGGLILAWTIFKLAIGNLHGIIFLPPERRK
ncbi:cbb3-type cytochrome c oxidase subunit I [Metallumcola ferriviriculae]|uniref:Cbb3-type cytochrome c oxidase subunit I n=1 Tax=Metallumcola ferriviriculae TaxID=3039180 RepID=A0AAU0US27_9FIRM|nr:cbb3-type cytochrome c oxidase subunit I [Desulfitibacteraceae bacterium MK1]